VQTLSDAAHELKMKRIRAGVRINSRVPVTVEWQVSGETHAVSGYTVDISPKGCLAVVPQGFAIGQKITLRNSINGSLSEAKLIWRGHEGRSGWELGLELENPPVDFWGLEF
jgi:PilZ domain